MHWWCIGTKNKVNVHWWIIFWFYMQSGWDIFLMINCCFVFNSIPSTNYCFIQTNSVQTRASQYFCTDISDVDYLQQCDAKMFLLLLKESSKKLLKYYQNIRSNNKRIISFYILKHVSIFKSQYNRTVDKSLIDYEL